MANVDIRPNNPYREVEMYLQKAEEEICITLQELNDRSKNGKRQQQQQVAALRVDRLTTIQGSHKSNIVSDEEIIAGVSSASSSSVNSPDNNNSLVNSGRNSKGFGSGNKKSYPHPPPPLPAPRKRNTTLGNNANYRVVVKQQQQSPRIVHHLMQSSLKALPAWSDENYFCIRNSTNSANSNKFVPSTVSHVNPNAGIPQRSVSVRELPQTVNLSSNAFLSSSCSQQPIAMTASSSVCNLDFSSTESVNRWFSHMLAELDSIPNVCCPGADDSSYDQQRNSLDRNSRNSVDRKLQEACYGLRDIGGGSITLSSSPNDSVTDSSTIRLRRNNDRNSNCKNTPLYGSTDNAIANNTANRLSFTWPMELQQTKQERPLADGGSSCEIYSETDFVASPASFSKASSSSVKNEVNASQRCVVVVGKDLLTPTPSLAMDEEDDVYSSAVTPLASSSPNGVVCVVESFKAASPPLCFDDDASATARSEGNFGVVAEKPSVTVLQKSDVATEISNSLKMQQHHHHHQYVNSPRKLVAINQQPSPNQWPVGSVNDSSKPKKTVAQEYASTNVLSLNCNHDFRQSSPLRQHSSSHQQQQQHPPLKQSNTELPSPVVAPTADTFQQPLLNLASGNNSIRGVVARIIKLAETEITPNISVTSNSVVGALHNNADRRSVKCRSVQYSEDGFMDDNASSVLSNDASLCNSQQYLIECQDACTQTTPFSLSRSSSFTWMSENEVEHQQQQRYCVNETLSPKGKPSSTRSSSDSDDDDSSVGDNNADGDNDDDGDSSSVNSTSDINVDGQLLTKRDVEISLCLSELSGAESSDIEIDLDAVRPIDNAVVALVSKRPSTLVNNNNNNNSTSVCGKRPSDLKDLRPNLDNNKSSTSATRIALSGINSSPRSLKDDGEPLKKQKQNAKPSVVAQHQEHATLVTEYSVAPPPPQRLPSLRQSSAAVDPFGESLKTLLEAAATAQGNYASNEERAAVARHPYKVNNFTTALEASVACSATEQQQRPNSQSQRRNVADAVVVDNNQQRASFNVPTVVGGAVNNNNINNNNNWTNSKHFSSKTAAVAMDADDDVIYDNLPNVCRPSAQLQNFLTSTYYRSELVESPASTVDISESAGGAMARDISLASGLLADSESSPVADSGSSPMSPVVDRFHILDSMRSVGDQSKQDSVNSFTSSESSFNLVQPAPEFQFQTGEDYVKERQREKDLLLRTTDCFSPFNGLGYENDELTVEESVLVRRHRTSSNSNKAEQSLPMRDDVNSENFQRVSNNDRSRNGVRYAASNGQTKVKGKDVAAPAMLSVEMKYILAGSLPVLDRLRDADDILLSANNCNGFGSGDGSVDEYFAKDGTDRNGILSNKTSAEKEARQCCRWLRAAGFPQYARLYEDHQFPVDVKSVQKDHEFLDSDSLQALYRRLHILNQCALLKLDNDARSRTPDDDSDDDADAMPLSKRWKFVRKSRTWSRIVNEIGENVGNDINLPTDSSSISPPAMKATIDFSSSAYNSSLEKSNQQRSVGFAGKPPTCSNGFSSTYQKDGQKPTGSYHLTTRSADAEDIDYSPKIERKLQRSQSERIKDKAKAFVKRMDFRSNNKRRKSPALADRNAVAGDQPFISSPVLIEHNGQAPRMFGDVSAMFNKQKDTQMPGAESPARPRTSGSHHTSALDERRRGRVFPSMSSAEFEKVDVNGMPATTGFGIASVRSSQQQQQQFRTSYQSSSIPNNNRHNSNTDNVFVPNLPTPTSLAVAQLQQQQSRMEGHFQKLLVGENSLHKQDSNRSVGSRSRVDFEKTTKTDYFSSDSSPETFPKTPAKTTSSLRVEVEVEQQSSRQQLHSSLDSSDTETAQYWERRDSGVGSSLSRSPSAPAKPRVRWHSFQRQHRPPTILEKSSMSSVLMDSLSVSQITTLQKFALLKLTALMEKYSPSHKTSGWHWGVQKLFKRMKSSDQKIVRDKQIFGIPLTLIAQRTGQPLPQCILHAMRYLRKQSLDTVGIFRKSGVRSRILKLKVQCESSSELSEYDSQQAYDVADLVKQYFRELPEPLLTSKLSETFVAIHLNVPEHLRMEAMRKAVLLLPDENREALHSFVHFLHDIAAFSDTNQMTAQNLAVCLAPTLFQLSSRNMAMSPQRRHKTITGGLPNEKELNENRAAQACLTVMIDECRRIFTVPEDIMMRCSYTPNEQDEPALLNELGSPHGNYSTYLNGCVDILLREHRERWRGWVTEGACDGVEMSSKKVADGHTLKLWRCWADVEAPPKELLHRILRERDTWDDDIIKWRVLRKLADCSEVFQYVCNDMPPHPTRDYCVVRKWLPDMSELRGGCILVETSVTVPEAPKMGGVRGVVLASRYLIEPSGAGRSRITHIARFDTKGRSKNWYNKIFGHVCANQIARIRDSFRQLPDGPETKV